MNADAGCVSGCFKVMCVPHIIAFGRKSAVNPINSADPYTSKFSRTLEERMNINGQTYITSRDPHDLW